MLKYCNNKIIDVFYEKENLSFVVKRTGKQFNVNYVSQVPTNVHLLILFLLLPS